MYRTCFRHGADAFLGCCPVNRKKAGEPGKAFRGSAVRAYPPPVFCDSIVIHYEGVTRAMDTIQDFEKSSRHSSFFVFLVHHLSRLKIPWGVRPVPVRVRPRLVCEATSCRQTKAIRSSIRTVSNAT